MRPWLHLARISNLPTVWTNVTAAWLLSGGAFEDTRLYWLILAGSLLYTGGMILNDAADVKFDRQHRKERPIPAGQVSLKAAWIVGIGMLLLGAWLALVFGVAHPLFIAGLIVCILFYDLYHKPWAGSVVVMGACRAFLICMAGSARLADTATEAGWLVSSFYRFGLDALGFMPGLVLLHACAVGVYTVALSVAARSGGKSGVRWLIWAPAVSFLAGKGMVLSLETAAPMALFLVPAAFVLLVTSALVRLKHSRIDAAVGLLLAGFVIADALAICTMNPAVALIFVALAPLLRVWQRWIAAT